MTRIEQKLILDDLNSSTLSILRANFRRLYKNIEIYEGLSALPIVKEARILEGICNSILSSRLPKIPLKAKKHVKTID